MTQPAHTKATRDDWIAAALARIDIQPIDQLKVLSLAGDLGVSRSSFYWYFTDPKELQDELLTVWRQNTASIVERSERDADSIVSSVLAIYECWADASLYHAELDVAVRDWARRDSTVAELVREGDVIRLKALETMFLRHGADEAEATTRSRMVYHGQVGYYAVESNEATVDRLRYLPHYLLAITATEPSQDELDSFERFLRSIKSL